MLRAIAITDTYTPHRYLARVVQVFPPRPPYKPSSSRTSPEGQASSSTTPLPDEEPIIHKIAEDLKISVQDSIARDDPKNYYYKIQILEEERSATQGKASDRNKGKEVRQSKYTGSLMDVRCSQMR